MGFKKADGSEVSVATDVSVNDTILVTRNNGNTNQATAQTLGDTLGFFSSADASALIADEVAQQVSAGGYITSADASVLIDAAVSTQIEAGGFLTSVSTQALIDSETHLTTAEVCTLVETYGYISSALTTAQAQALVDAETHLTTAEVCGIAEAYGYATLTTAQADALYTTTAQAQALVDAETHVTTAEVSTIVEAYGYLTSALTTAQADAFYQPVGQYVVSNTSALAIGIDSTTVGDDGVAIGVEANAGGNTAIAIGYQASAFDAQAIAIGDNAAAGSLGVAIGVQSSAPSTGIAIGFLAVADGSSNIVIGDTGATLAGTSGAIAIGQNALGLAQRSTAIGADTSIAAAASGAILIGASSQTAGARSIVIGQSSKSTHDDTFLIGTDLTSDFTDQFKFGPKTLNLGQFNTSALETDRNEAAREGAIAYDSEANVLKVRDDTGWVSVGGGGGGGGALNDLTDVSVGTPADLEVLTFVDGDSLWQPRAVGNLFTGAGSESVLIATTTAPGQALQFGDVAIGGSAIAGTSTGLVSALPGTASADRNVAIGYQAEATGRKSVAIGNLAIANNINSTAVGQGSQCGGHKSTVIGNDSVIVDLSVVDVFSGIIGANCCVSGFRSFAIGHNVNINHDDAFILGGGIDSDHDDQFKFGAKTMNLGEFNTSALETDHNTAAHEGAIAYNSETNKLNYRNDTVWLPVADEGVLAITSVSATTYEFTKNNSVNSLLIFEGATAVSTRVPTCASVSMAVGTQIDFVQYGSGQVTINGTAGVSVVGTGTALRARYSAGTITKIKPDTWSLVGDLEQS